MIVRARCDAIGLSYFDPRPSIATRHGIRMTSGTAELRPRTELDLIVANFTRVDRILPINSVIGYAERNPLAITTLPVRLATRTRGMLTQRLASLKTLQPRPRPRSPKKP